MPALMSLYAEITANTAKFDRGIASARGQAEALTATLGRVRDANGRFIAGMQRTAAVASAVRIRPPAAPPPSFRGWLDGVRTAVRGYDGFIGPALARTGANAAAGLGFPLRNFLGLATAGARIIGSSYAEVFSNMRAGLAFPANSFLNLVGPPVVSAVRAVGSSFAYVFSNMRAGLAFPTNAFLNLVGPSVLRGATALGREFTSLGRIAGAAFGPLAARARASLGGAFSGVGAGLSRSLAGVGGLFTSVIGPAAARGASLISGAFGGALRGVASGVGSIGSAFGGVIGKLKFPALLAGGAALAGLGLATSAAIDMEKRITGLSKATDATGPRLAGMKNQLLALSTSLKGVALNDLIDIATTGAKMGIAEGGLLKFTEGIAKASTAVDDMSALDLAESVGKINTVFKLGDEGALQLASAFDKLADSGVSSFSGIANVVGRISGAAVAAKITAQESAALAAALLDTGTHAELGATSLSRLIAGLNDAEAHATFGKVLGVSAEEFAGKVKASPITAIQEFLAALNKLSAGDQMKTLKDIGFEGVQGAGEIQKLAAQAESLGLHIGRANSEFKTLDQVNKSYNATAALASSGFVQMQNRIQIMADVIGTALMPLTSALGESFGFMAEDIGKFIEASKGEIGVFLAPMVTGAKNLSLLFRQFPTFLALAGVEAEALALKITTVFGRIGAFLGDLFGKVAANFKAQFVNAVDDAFNLLVGKAANLARLLGPDLLARMGVLGTTISALGVASTAPRAPAVPVPAITPNIGLLGGLFKGLDLKSLDPRLAEERAKRTKELNDARAERDRNKDFVGPLKPTAAFAPQSSLIPRGLTPSALAALGVVDPFASVGAAVQRSKVSPRQRAAARARRAAAAPPEKKLTKAQARRALVLQRQARAGLKATKKPSADFLEQIDAGINALVGINKDVAKELKKGPVARFGAGK